MIGSANDDQPGFDDVIGEKFEWKIFFGLSRRKVDRFKTGQKRYCVCN
jgi:hypothetical protein